MSDSRLYPVTAIILRSRDYGEAHCLISLLTREEGKVLAVARGLKKPKARLAPSLQHFTLAEIQLATGRRFDVITQVRVLNAFYSLRTNVEAFLYASYFAELFDETLEERQHHPELFDLMVEAQERLCEGDPVDLVARCVEINLVAALGYLPHLIHCAKCGAQLMQQTPEGKVLLPTWLGFSAPHGGALCPDCHPNVPGARRIAAGVVQVGYYLLKHGFDGIGDLHLSDRLRREIEKTFREYLEYRLERRLNSTRFLHDLKEGAEQELSVPSGVEMIQAL